MVRRILASLYLCGTLLLASPVHAEKAAEKDASGKMEYADFLKYLAKVKEKNVNPMDAYILNEKGERISLSSLRGKPILLHFWATWCAPCVAELPKLAKLGEDLSDDGLQIVAVSEDFGGIDTVKDFYARQKIVGIAPYADIMTGLANTLEVSQLPVTVIIDKNGKVIGRTQGIVHWDDSAVRDKMCEIIN